MRLNRIDRFQTSSEVSLTIIIDHCHHYTKSIEKTLMLYRYGWYLVHLNVEPIIPRYNKGKFITLNFHSWMNINLLFFTSGVPIANVWIVSICFIHIQNQSLRFIFAGPLSFSLYSANYFCLWLWIHFHYLGERSKNRSLWHRFCR